MGLFNKLKNALFEEEEIDLEPEVSKVVIADEEEKKPEKEASKPKKEVPLENERELFKADNTFNFPDFDEEEFVTNYENKKEEKPKKKAYDIGISDYDLSKKHDNVERKRPSIRREKSKVKEEITVKKSFKPSPVISPVYGILDKNYNKEDFIKKEIEEDIPKNKAIDVDLARKKAFGTLEDDIEKTLNENVDNFYSESKSVDELLDNTIDTSIEIDYDDNEIINEEDSIEKIKNNIEEELDNIDENIEEVISESTKKEEYTETNTLENDLFDLIDSMYDEREEE